MNISKNIISASSLLLVFALSSCGSGDSNPPSNADTSDNEAPSTFSNITASASYQSVSLSWTAATDNVGIDHYQVLRDGSDIGSTTTTFFTDTTVREDSDYSYQVVAFDAVGNSASPAAISVSVPPYSETDVQPPTAVTNLNGSATDQSVSLTWSAATDNVGIDHYQINRDTVTIAGQTAQGAGITIHGQLTCDYSNPPDNIIVRHIRVRADHSTNPTVTGEQYDGIQCSGSDLIFDHISLSGGVDENFDLYSATNVTVQWSTISRSDTNGGHPEGEHNYGLINGPDGANISIHHNLFAHNKNRNPAIANGPSEIINNVVYNVRHGFVHHNPSTGNFNIIGNYYKQGPENSLIPFFFDDEYSGSGSPLLSYYLENNYIDDPGDYVGSVDNPWLSPAAHSSFDSIDWGWDSSVARSDQRHLFSQPVETIYDAEANYELVLNQAGAFPRDVIDSDNVAEVRDRSGAWGLRMPTDLMQGLTADTPPLDSDNDGMPDSWESSNGLSNVIDDHNSLMPSGYSAIEAYINQLPD